MTKYEKLPVGRFTRYKLYGWTFYVNSDHEAIVEKDLEERPDGTAKIMVMLSMSDYAIDNEWKIAKFRADPTRVIETFLRTL